MFQKLSKKILVDWCGWTINVTEPHPDKYIIAVAPHTSNWDFIIGQLFAHSLGIRINFMMKSSWFFWPMGILMRHLGGIPVKQSKHMNSTERIIREALDLKEFRLCITPEGTRRATKKWRTGFYYIALGAHLPILLYGVDFERKLIQCTKTVIPTGCHMMRLLLLLLLISQAAFSQEKAIQQSLSNYLSNYINPNYSNKERYRVENIVFHGSDTMELQFNEPFLGQPFTTATVKRVYREVAEHLPAAYRHRPLLITVCGHRLEELVAAYQLPKEQQRSWGTLRYKGAPWVKNLDRAHVPTRGLEGHHLALWASHGRYYKNDKNEWVWQRPLLHTTCEDLYTSTVVYPYLMPMLERAGAVLFSPRERSWQKREYLDGIVREEGDYPVYILYEEADKPLIVNVIHEGAETHLAVNRSMGAGTWCYLGTWHFKAGDDRNNCVTANDDIRVRLGGGMGSIRRGGQSSGYGRAWEGSRYWAEYNMMPEPLWTTKDGTNDYAEDMGWDQTWTARKIKKILMNH